MKKSLPVVITIMCAAIMLGSCNKDYTCTCTVSGSGVSTHVISYDIGKTSKNDAQSKCNAMRTEYTDSLSGVGASCHL